MSHAEKAGKTESPDPLPTIWEVPDDLWELIERVLVVYDPAPKMGRPRIDQRKALNGILYRARTGCQWNHLPQEFGDDVSIHRTMQRWEGKGIFDIVWAILITKSDLFGGVEWDWQAADCALGKARGIGKKGRPRKPRQASSEQHRCASDLTPRTVEKLGSTPKGHPAFSSREAAVLGAS